MVSLLALFRRHTRQEWPCSNNKARIHVAWLCLLATLYLIVHVTTSIYEQQEHEAALSSRHSWFKLLLSQ